MENSTLYFCVLVKDVVEAFRVFLCGSEAVLLCEGCDAGATAHLIVACVFSRKIKDHEF